MKELRKRKGYRKEWKDQNGRNNGDYSNFTGKDKDDKS